MKRVKRWETIGDEWRKGEEKQEGRGGGKSLKWQRGSGVRRTRGGPKENEKERGKGEEKLKGKGVICVLGGEKSSSCPKSKVLHFYMYFLDIHQRVVESGFQLNVVVVNVL